MPPSKRARGPSVAAGKNYFEFRGVAFAARSR